MFYRKREKVGPNEIILEFPRIFEDNASLTRAASTNTQQGTEMNDNSSKLEPKTIISWHFILKWTLTNCVRLIRLISNNLKPTIQLLEHVDTLRIVQSPLNEHFHFRKDSDCHLHFSWIVVAHGDGTLGLDPHYRYHRCRFSTGSFIRQ